MDTIIFDPELAYETIQLSEPEILLDKDLVIIGLGAGATTIAGSTLARVFHIVSGVSVYLQDLTLCCGHAMGNGDVILNEGHTVMKDVNIYDK